MKIKTRKSIAKRFKKSKNGKIVRHYAFTSHLKSKKTGNKKRRMRKGVLISKSDYKRLKRVFNLI
ncbi:50S ribosomal protein L35 [symbiont of Argiope bruennichi]|uniref:50S ribosomal protein L35 n=1 Tax=symbiont of Argiope bruennichi TaxID=2810479 RepID=UPI003DA32652